jgi:DNA-binding NtrC family response regulator
MSRELAILYIEDSDDDFWLIERELKRAGMIGTLRRIENHEALRAAMAEQHWDIVLSDYSLPEMDFIETLAYMKHHWPDVPLILISATIGETKGSVMVKLGTRDFVSKDNLADLVPSILRQIERGPAS